MTDYELFINGQWATASSNRRINSINPTDGQIAATFPTAAGADVDTAFRSARAAQKGWALRSATERGDILRGVGQALIEQAELFGGLETAENGKLLRENVSQAKFAGRVYKFFGAAVASGALSGRVIPLDAPNLFDYTLFEPYGVCGLIVAWNSPLQLLANKLAPALAAGNSAVVKPSEFASSSVLEFAAAATQAGLPAGVFNVVTGGSDTGALIASHTNADKVSFTGGEAGGRLVGIAAIERLSPVTLELGGKSPNIIFEDANLGAACLGAVAGIFSSSGQSCIAGSRLLVHRSIHDEVVERVIATVSGMNIGDPTVPTTDMGPLANQPQLQRVKGHVETAAAEGAVLKAGGSVITTESPLSCFFEPTIFIDTAPGMHIANEEVFGPVLSVLKFDSEAEAIKIANGTKYGLASGIWTQNLSRAHRVAKAIDAGTVWVNTYRTSAPQAPFGGTKSSGFGRERGVEGLHEYVRVKNVLIDLNDDSSRDPFVMKIE